MKLIKFLLVLTLVLFLSPQAGVVATPVTSAVVISEIDYDQESTDNAEFIEIMNNSVDSINLDSYAFKSKGSVCSGDSDTGDGQGNCNLTRTAAAAALTGWLGTPQAAARAISSSSAT